MTADPSPLVLAVVAAAYAVLLLLPVWWQRHRDRQAARRWQTGHRELMRELEHYESESE
jgi:hypothetical protein